MSWTGVYCEECGKDHYEGLDARCPNCEEFKRTGVFPGTLSPTEIAKDLGKPLRTIQNYCKEGFLPASLHKVIGKRAQYVIDEAAYAEWKAKNLSGKGDLNKYTNASKMFLTQDALKEVESLKQRVEVLEESFSKLVQLVDLKPEQLEEAPF